MALGRSNSLSLNTTAVNSSFAQHQQQQQQQQQQQPQSQPQQQAAPTGGSLFGGSLFGNQQNQTQNQPQTSQAGGGSALFGGQANMQTSQPALGASLFGNTGSNVQPSQQPFGSASLFGGQQGQQGQQQSQPAAGGGLFGGSGFGGQQQHQQQNQQQPQPAAGGGLFGGGGFGGQQNQNQNQNQQQPQPATGGSLFGGGFGAQSNQSKPADNRPLGTSLFGGAQQSTQQPQSGAGLFGATQNANPPASNSLFASLNQAQPNPLQASLLGASRYNLGQPAPFTGRLTMGQGSAVQTSAAPATKLSWDNVRSTTRFNDLVDPAKEQLEAVDKMIQEQERHCREIEAILPMHANNLDTLRPDVELIAGRCDEAEQGLVTDAQGVQHAKELAERDAHNILRCERIGDNLRLPAQYQYAPAASIYGARRHPGAGAGAGAGANNTSDPTAADDGSQDTDLVGNYFLPMAGEMRRLLDTYQANLGEIESHMHTIEATAVMRMQLLGQQRARGGDSGEDPVAQLADTLRGFEGTILATAAKVGACREGVTDVVMGNSAGPRGGRGAW